MKNLSLKLILIFIFITLFFSSDVLATTVFSPLLELEADPGQSQNGVVKVFNETDQDLFLVASVEPFTAGDEEGQPVYLLPEEKHDFLNWFKIEQDSLVLRPNQVAIIPFTIEVPVKAVPGGYYAVIFWETVKDESGEEPMVGVSSKVGTLIFLKVKGEVEEKGEILEFITRPEDTYFFSGPISFVTRFSNVGNVHLKPFGQIELKGWLGQTKIFEVNTQKRNVLPDTIRRFEVVWGESSKADDFLGQIKSKLSHFVFGKYTATLNLTYGVDNPQILIEQLNFWFIPVHLIVVLLVIIIILIILIKINSKIKKLKKSLPTSSDGQKR